MKYNTIYKKVFHKVPEPAVRRATANGFMKSTSGRSTGDQPADSDTSFIDDKSNAAI